MGLQQWWCLLDIFPARRLKRSTKRNQPHRAVNMRCVHRYDSPPNDATAGRGPEKKREAQKGPACSENSVLGVSRIRELLIFLIPAIPALLRLRLRVDDDGARRVGVYFRNNVDVVTTEHEVLLI